MCISVYSGRMPSLFPDFFTYQQLAPLFIRLVLAVIFLGNGYLNFSKNRKFWVQFMGATEMISGGLLLAGFLTQLAAIWILVITTISLIKIKREKNSWADYEYNLLVIASAIALLFLGPGIFSIDLPL